MGHCWNTHGFLGELFSFLCCPFEPTLKTLRALSAEYPLHQRMHGFVVSYGHRILQDSQEFFPEANYQYTKHVIKILQTRDKLNDKNKQSSFLN